MLPIPPTCLPHGVAAAFFPNNSGQESSAAAALACALVPSEKTDTRPGNEGRMLKCHRVQRITDPAARSCAMNYGCWYAIVRSEKTHTLACNEFPECWCAIGLRRATNYRCCSAIVCNELRLLIRHRAVRKDTHAGLQRIPSADWPSCGQRRHTRWPATNSGWWCDFVPSETGQKILGLNDFRVKRF